MPAVALTTAYRKESAVIFCSDALSYSYAVEKAAVDMKVVQCGHEGGAMTLLALLATDSGLQKRWR